MSLNQSRSDKGDSQFRKSGGGRSSGSSGGQHRTFTGGRGRGGAPSNTAPNLSTSRSFKKNNDAQGGQPRGAAVPVNPADSNAPSGAISVQNGSHVQSTTLHGGSTMLVQTSITKPADASAHRSSRPLPKFPSSQITSTTSDSTLPSTPEKGDGVKGLSLQFGTISQSFMIGSMQVPPRTSSAPPNLDEQKCDQGLRDSSTSRAILSIPLPSAPKQGVPKKDQQPVVQETHTELRPKRDVELASASPPIQTQKSCLPITGMSMPLPFHQPVPMQFSGPSQQMQPQVVLSSSLQMPMQMPLHMENPSQVQQQVFVPGLQHHLMQTQGFIHEGQNFAFNPQIGTQLPHQIGNLGMNMPANFNQQQVGKFVNNHKAVKITHPDTHEELRLDSKDGGSSGSRLHRNGPAQPQALSNHTLTRPISYPNSYTAGPPLFPVPSSLSSTSAQSNVGSQLPRTTYSVSQAPSTVLSSNQYASNTISIKKAAPVEGKPDSTILDNTKDVQDKVTSSQLTSTRVIGEAEGSFDCEEITDSNVFKEAEAPKLLNSTLEIGVVKDSQLKLDIYSASAESLAPGTSEVSPIGVHRKSSKPSAVDAIKVTSVENDLKQAGQKGDSRSSLQDFSNSCTDVVSEYMGAKMNLTFDPSDESFSHPAENYESQTVVNEIREDRYAKQSDQSGATKEKGKELPEELLSGDTLKVMDAIKGTHDGGEFRNIDNGGVVTDSAQRASESVSSHTGGDKIGTQGSSFGISSSSVTNSCDMSDSGSSLGITRFVSSKDYDASKSSTPDNEATTTPTDNTEADLEQMDAVQNLRPSSSSGTESGNNKGFVESNKTKNNRGKKKWKEMLQKADALATSDLYIAFKGPEEKKEPIVTAKIPSESSSMEVPADIKQEVTKNEDDLSKPELDDWEDAAEISTPKLQSSGSGNDGRTLHNEEGITAKKYSRDFLLTFSEQCTVLPVGFEITSDIEEALMRASFNTCRGDYEFLSAGKIIDRSMGPARLDRCANGTMDPDRRSRLPGTYSSGRDAGIDLAHNSNLMGFRTVPGPNYGVLRNPRVQGPVQAAGILSGPMHSLGFQGVQRNYSDVDRWQRAANYNKGLMPVPQTPLQPMHKAEKKYEVGKISDEEQAKQRKLKAILNKLTPENFVKLFEQVKEVNIDNDVTLTGVISQIFDKALMEPTFCEMYANFCLHLASALPDFIVDNETITFRRLLLNKCQEEFEREEREEKEANEDDAEGEVKQSEAEREEKRLKARRRMLGNIRLIGELYKKRMLTEKIMHYCINKLLGQDQTLDEENIEALCKLMSTIGEMIDHPRAKDHMDAYYDIMGQLSNNMKLSSRVRFILKDAIDLRKNKWQQRRKVEGPKKIEEVHRDVAQERHGQAARLSRGPSMNSATRRGQPVEFSPRGPMLSSPVGQGGSYRGMSAQTHGYGAQDIRMDERNVSENRSLSVLLPQRSGSDESITLGPQGGLARGMAFRGQPSVPNSHFSDSYSSYGDPRRIPGGLNGYNSASDRGAYRPREDHFGRHNSERFGCSGSFDQSNCQEHTLNYVNGDLRYPDQSADRPRPTTPPVAEAGGSPGQNVSSEKVLSEERLREKSLAAVKEYYSAKDEKEVALCIKDLNAPSFYPMVVAIWVADSFERRDMERDLLAKLLVNLAKPQEGLFSASELIEGFQSVLCNLEDTVTDAPRAPEFLGRIFGEVVVANIVHLTELGQLIRQGGEEAGNLVEAGLAADVLGNVLEMIKSEKGESVLNQLHASSNLRLEDFRPPDPVRSRKLEMFM